MLNSLDALIIVFIAMAVLSIISVALQFIVKNKKFQKASFYFASILGALLSIFKYLSTPLTGLYTGQIVLGFALGALAIAAIILQLVKKDDKSFQLAKVLTAVSVIGGMIGTFLI